MGRSSVPLRLQPGTPVEVRDLMQRMGLREMVAQLVIVPFYRDMQGNRRREDLEYLRLVKNTGVGGLILLNRAQNGVIRNADPYAVSAFLNQMQKQAKVPLIVGGDFERGASMRVLEMAKFPHAMAYGAANDLEATRKTGEATARESRALGVHWLFAPVADVNNNPDNPIINTRSFGEDPKLVAAHVKAYIEGAHSAKDDGVLVTVKHFPGQGDTTIDTHLGIAKVPGDRKRLDTLELLPFRAAIAAGVDGVMMGHLAVPAIEDREIPATMSAKVIQGLLRKELGFEGLAVTDAMDMLGLTNHFSAGEAAVRAIEAGVDVLLIPASADRAIQGVLNAVSSGRLKVSRIHESVAKILSAKHKLGLFEKRLVNLEEVRGKIHSQESADLAQFVAQQALSIVKNEQGIVPLRDPSTSCLVTLAENRFSTSGNRMMEDVMARSPKMRTIRLDPTMKPEALSETAAGLNQCSTIVIAAFVAAASFKGDVVLTPVFATFVDQVIALKRPVVFCAVGSPYLLRKVPLAAGHIATFSTTVTSEAALIRGLFGEIPMGARSPVTIAAP